MKHLIFLQALVLFFIYTGCTPSPKARTGEGTITYRVSYPDSSRYGMKAALFPKTIVLIFKDEKAVFIATGGFGMVQIVNLLDHKEKKYTSLLIDGIRQNYGCRLTPGEIAENENNPVYRIEEANETKKIAGLECRKAIVKNAADNSAFEIYYDDKIKFYYWNSPFKDFNYLFMEYTHTINNMTMKLEAISADFSSPVDTSLFNVKGNFLWVNQKQFFSHINEL